MKYNRCGNTGVLLPSLSLGLWHNFGAGDSYEEARKMVHAAFDNGICAFDLANNYGPPPGSAEETLGKLMSTDFRPHRDEMFISTKAGHDMWSGVYGTWNSRKHLFASLHQSLKRMQLDYVDVFYSHRYDPETPLEETCVALADMVRQGKALYVAISKYPPEAMRRAAEILHSLNAPCLMYQGRLSLLSQQPIEDGILDACEELGMGFVAFSSLAQGLLTNKYIGGTIPEGSRMQLNEFLKGDVLTPALLDKLQKLSEYAREARNESLATMALAWVLWHKQVSSVIIGASRVSQLIDSLGVINAREINSEDAAQIAAILR